MGFNELDLGATIELKGPIGSFTWGGRGTFRYGERSGTGIRKLGFVCGGSGITPILQVLRAVLQDEEDKLTEMWLLDANKTELDILCREELDNHASLHGSRLRVHYTLSSPSKDWTSSKGRITDEMMKDHLPSPGDNALILVCGPDPMIDQTVKPGLKRLGWDITKSLVVF